LSDKTDKRTVVGDITGGKAPAELLPDDSVTIEILWDTYRWYPGFAEMHDLEVKAIWSNGLTGEKQLQADRLLELKKGHVFAYLAGYVAYVLNTDTNPPSVKMWNPAMDGIGFTITRFSEFGYPLEIRIQAGFNENNKPIHYPVQAYPVETKQIEISRNDDTGEVVMGTLHIRERPAPKGNGFFIVRNSRGLPGARGLPEFLALVHAVRAQLDILNAYTPYAKKQGMAFPVVYHEYNTPTNRANVKSQFDEQPQTNRLLQMSTDDLVEWVSPQANAYDPFPILTWIDQLIARRTQMTQMMLTGTAEGQLSSSSTGITNWIKEIKEQQVFWKSQFAPIFEVLGAEKDVAFQDPTEPAFIDLMDGLKAAREAMIDVVENESIVGLFNEYLKQNNKDWELKAISNEEMNENNNGGNGEDGDSGQPKHNNKPDEKRE
jgi:hypothetical protein